MKKAKTLLDSFAYYANLLTFISVTLGIVFGFSSLNQNGADTSKTLDALNQVYIKNHYLYQSSHNQQYADSTEIKVSLKQKERDHDRFEKQQDIDNKNMTDLLEKLHKTLDTMNEKIAFNPKRKEIAFSGY